MTWRIVGYHDATGYRTVMPIEWPTREEAETVMRVVTMLASKNLRYVIETSEEEPRVQ